MFTYLKIPIYYIILRKMGQITRAARHFEENKYKQPLEYEENKLILVAYFVLYVFLLIATIMT